MSEIKWKIPGQDATGFLRRRREVIALLDAEPTPENNDALLTYLSKFVENPKALLDCTRREYGKAILDLLGYGFKVPDPKGESSEQP